MTSLFLRAMLSAEGGTVKTLIVACALAAAFSGSSTAAAQYPARPVRIITGVPAGGTADTVARIVAQPLSQVLGQPVLIDNRLGADGAISAELTAKSAPDGHTLLWAGNTNMLGVPILRKNPPYDPLADFAPITPVVKFAFFLVVHPSVPAKTPLELIDYARANPGKLNYASGNVNGILAAAQLMSIGKLDMVHVPYKGEVLAIPDLLNARVHMMFGTGGVTAPLVKEGRLRALATLLPVKSSLLPDVPTMAEAGMPQLSVVIWGGLFGPAKLPKEIVERISREVNVILQRPEIRGQLVKQGVEPAGSTPAEFAAFLKQQLADWGKAAREAGLKPE
jgi:tripartite-type tricarboxylate transporter receptor subunit TctC